MYRIDCKLGHVITDDAGRIAEDHVGRSYVCEPHEGWMIVGFTTRLNAHHVITLAQAAEGADIGQGWVHDLDHGTHRMWGHPSYRRAVKVTRIA